IMGLDSLGQLPEWKDPQRLIKLCRLVAVQRPRYEINKKELEVKVPGLWQRAEIITMPEVDISSSDLQERVKTGLPIKYQVPPAVEEYIYSQGLYR
ncbi:MAG: nicotinic acid mononucleotide adenylyltransferase, partial [Chloroflexi bacterium]|nr:nicotinic acid mononucleotide adenylyltransferase [Chloroflexota bacterium]